MSNFTVHDLESAPEASRPFLEAAQKKFGFIPNVLRIQAEAPALVEGYMTLSGIFGKSGLSPAEQQTILLAASVENKCHYCAAAHTGGALGAGVDKDDVEAIRIENPLADKKLDALVTFTRKMVKERGWLKEEDLAPFMAAGYSRADAMNVVLGIAVKTMTHYVNHMADTMSAPPLHTWVRKSATDYRTRAHRRSLFGSKTTHWVDLSIDSSRNRNKRRTLTYFQSESLVITRPPQTRMPRLFERKSRMTLMLLGLRMSCSRWLIFRCRPRIPRTTSFAGDLCTPRAISVRA